MTRYVKYVSWIANVISDFDDHQYSRLAKFLANDNLTIVPNVFTGCKAKRSRCNDENVNEIQRFANKTSLTGHRNFFNCVKYFDC